MKNVFKISALISVLALFVWFLSPLAEQEKIKQNRMPEPTEIVKLDKAAKKKFKQDRKAWIESLHKAEKGVDWRTIDHKTLEKKRIHKMGKRKELVLKNKLRKRSISSILQKNGVTPVQSPPNGTGLKAVNINNNTLQGTWHERGSNNLSGRIMETDVDFDEGVIYALSAGGIVWAGDLSGNNWEPLNDYMKINDAKNILALPMNGTTRVAVLNAKNVYYTDDYGTTWDTASGLKDPNTYGELNRMIITGSGANSIIYVLSREYNYTVGRTEHRIYKSTDKGTSFIKMNYVSTPVKDPFIWAPRYNNNSKAYIIEDQRLSSIDEFENVTLISTMTLPVSLSRIECIRLTGLSTGSKQIFYALFETDDSSYVKISINSGSTWLNRTPISARTFTHNSFTASAKDTNAVFMGSVEGHRSLNRAGTWTVVNGWGEYYGDMDNKLHADIPHIGSFIDKNGSELILISTDGGIYKSTDTLRTVKTLCKSGLRISQYYSVYTNRSNTGIIYAGSQDQGFQRTRTDQGGVLDFKQLISGDYGQIVSGNNGRSVWTVYPGFTMFYSDAANDTNAYTLGFGNLRGHSWMPPLMEDPENSDNVYLGGGGLNSGAHLQRITWNGSWLTTTEESFDFSRGTGANISSMAYSPINSDYRYVTNSNGDFFRTTDGGSNWQYVSSISQFGGHWLTGSSIVASPITLGDIYIGGSGYSNPPVYVSTDNGATFTAMSNGLPSTLVFDMAITPDGSKIFAATEVGPYVYIKSDAQWYDLAGLEGPDQTYWSVEYIESLETVRFGTYGRGIWDFKIENVYSITATANENGTISPSGTITVPEGSSQTFTITPNPGYLVYRVYVNGGNMGSVTSYTINNIQRDYTIVAYFTEDRYPPKYTITATSGANGSITPAGAIEVTKGNNQTFTITPINQGYRVKDVKVDGASVGSVTSYTFTNVTSSHSIDAAFAVKTPLSNVVISSTAGGTITPTGSVIEYIGEQIQLSLQPNPGYQVKALKIDGVSVGAVNNYQFNITLAYHTIVAEFETVNDCANIKTGGQSGNFNTTDTYCFKTKDRIQGWGCANMSGRTVSVTINGQGTPVTVCGAALPSKGTNDYYTFNISAGGVPWASIYWW